jgi:hypothetical protein
MFVGATCEFLDSWIHSDSFPSKIMHNGVHFHHEHMNIYYLYCNLDICYIAVFYKSSIVEYFGDVDFYQCKWVLLDLHFCLDEEICIYLLDCRTPYFKSQSILNFFIFLIKLHLDKALSFHEQTYNLLHFYNSHFS